MTDAIARFWPDLVGRLSGPMAFRFILQPAMATLFAIRAGLTDAREGRPFYLWTILTTRGARCSKKVGGLCRA